MSRINDALKRARKAQRQTLPPGLAPLPPAASRPDPLKMLLPTPPPGNIIGWILPGIVGLLLVAACLFIGLALVTRTPAKVAAGSNPPAAQPAKPTAAVALNPTPAPPPPEPKLQGIVYTAAQPWAIVNGRAVHVGDRLSEFRVKAISPREVTLEQADGSQKKLVLAN